MDDSFDLLSTMSPKFTKFVKPTKKLPTKLALKKHIRRSSVIFVSSKQPDESIISISSATSGSDSSSVKSVIISESESDKSIDKSPVKHSNLDYQLSKEKYGHIKSWLSSVEVAQKVNAILKSPTAALGKDEDDTSRETTKDIAFNSTFLQDSCKRFDELLDKYDGNIGDQFSKMTIIDDSVDLISDSFEKRLIDEKTKKNCSKVNDSFEKRVLNNEKTKQNCSNISDSFDKRLINDGKTKQICSNLDDCFEKRLVNNEKTKQNCSNISDSFDKRLIDEDKLKQNCPNVNYDDVENVLDKFYGKSWRPKREDILPGSEPRVKKKNENKRNCRIPATERPKKNSANGSNLTPLRPNTFNSLRPKTKSTESPWAKILNNLCDNETDSEDEHLVQTRLNFNEPEQEDQLKNVTKSKKTSAKSKNQLSSKVLLPSKFNIDSGRLNSKKPEKSRNDKGAQVVPNASFLASLSGSVPVARCDITALIYRTHFKQHKVELTRKLFDLFNEKVFNYSIPKNTVLEWNDKMRQTAGFCRCKKVTRRTGNIERYVQIDLASKVLDTADRLRDTLIHEMCHAATWVVDKVSDGHGSLWRAWADRALKAFPELPPIKTCHSYVINTKYTYRCQDCGYSVGRHTKSLDTERKCCGYCRGRFEVLINKTTKNGETKTMLATPKKTTGFALFVKENYANMKTPDINHAATMRLLSEKFSKMKT